MSEEFHLHKNKYRIMSFGAGVLLAYLILELLPQVFRGINILDNFPFIFILVGFSIFYLAEKYIYQHASKKRLLTELKEMHSVAFFIYYLIIGIIIFNITKKSILQGLLTTIPLIFHTTLGAASLNEIHPTIKENKLVKLILSFSPVAGFLLATFYPISETVNHYLLAFISGAFLYVITSEVIPKENKGDPVDFLLGLIIYTALILFIGSF